MKNEKLTDLTLKNYDIDVTTLIVTYNHGNWIENSIQSILNQKCNFNHKIFISDDCSTDKTIDICNKYQKLYPEIITFVSNNKNLGPEANYFTAFNKINSKYMAYCDGDDYWCDPLKLTKQISKLEENPSCIFSCHNTSKRNFDSPEFGKVNFIPISLNSGIYNKKNFLCFSHTSSRVIRTSLVREKITSFETSDLIMQAYMISLGDVYYISDIMSVYRRTGLGAWSGLNVEQKKIISGQVRSYIKNKFKYMW